MSESLRALFSRGSLVQYQMIQGRRVLLTYGSERMKELATEAGDDNLLRLPDEYFAPGKAWQPLLEEDPEYKGLAFYPYVVLKEASQAAVLPFNVTEGKVESLRMVIPSHLMIPEIGDWLIDFGDEVRSGGGHAEARSFPGSFHIILREMRVEDLMNFMEESLEVGVDILVMPVVNTNWVRHFIGRVPDST